MRLALCLFKYFPHSGLALDMLRIAREAVDRGHDVDIYVREWQGDTPANISVECLETGGLSNHGRAGRFIRRLAERLEEKAYDAVVGFNKMPGLDFYYAADSCFAAHALRDRRPAYRLSPRYRSWRRLEASVFGVSSRTRILLLAERARLEYRAFYATAEERMRVLPPVLDRTHQSGPLDTSRRHDIRASLGAGDDDMLLLAVGSGFHTKGVDRTLQALASLPETDRRRTRLAVVGRGKTRDLKRLATRLGVEAAVVFAGGRDDVPELLRAADLLIHPARRENTGTVLLEALAAGLPVIVTANCGYAHHVRDSGAGIVIEGQFDQGALSHALRNLVTDPERTRLGDRAARYGRDESLYRMPAEAVNLIETWNEIPSPPAFTGYVHPELSGLGKRLPRLDDWLQLKGEVFRRTPDRKTLRFAHSGRDYFLKAHFGIGWREIVKNLAQLKLPVMGAGNEWLAIHWLEMAGVRTPPALAYGSTRGWAGRRSFIVTRALEGMTSLEDYVAAQPSRRGPIRRRILIEQVARTARLLHGNGLNHRDLYLCHFLLDREPGDDRNIRLHLIDLHRAQVRRRTPCRWRIKDIAGLYYSAFGAALSRPERLRFIRTYSAAGSLREALAEESFWTRVERRARALRRAERRRGYADTAGVSRPADLGRSDGAGGQ